jgi:hypothetical protein
VSEERGDMPAEGPATLGAAATPPPVGLSDPPTRSEVLAYLDWEIQNTREQAKVVGASTWSLTLALGAVLWLLLSEARYSWAELPPVFYLICGFSLLQDFLAGAYYASREKVPRLTPVRRVVRPELIFGSRRRTILFSVLRCLGLLFALMHVPEYVTQPARWSAGVWFALPIPILLLAFLFSSLDVELPEPQEVAKKVKLRNSLIGTLFWLIPLVCGIIYWRPFLARRLTFPPEDYRTSLLIVVATFLGSLLLESRLRAEIQPELISLRRELALGTTRAEDAAQHASYVVSGLTADAYVQREFLKHEELLRAAGLAFTTIRDHLLEMETRVAAGSGQAPERAQGYLESLEPILNQLDRLDISVSSFRKKLERFADADTRRRFELKASSLEELIWARRGDVKSAIQRIKALIVR